MKTRAGVTGGKANADLDGLSTYQNIQGKRRAEFMDSHTRLG